MADVARVSGNSKPRFAAVRASTKVMSPVQKRGGRECSACVRCREPRARLG